ncbi:MAG: hypothetical protein NUV80_01090 [Candidatus Berkelbacteria bacterium]|nr:hypothetical protein [Candidatus Berkelbacteria bacterium]
MILNVYKKEKYEDIEAAISPKVPDLGNSLYYLIEYKGMMAMVTVPRKAPAEEAVQDISVGISQVIEKVGDCWWERLFKR